MKSNLSVRECKPHPRHWRALPICAAAFACLAALSGPVGAGTDGSFQRRGNAAGGAAHDPARTADARELWRGESRAAWTQRFWRWSMSIPQSVNPADPAGADNCSINQQGPVWFLGGPLGSAFTRSCTVPVGKAILSPVVAFINDYPCPEPPTFQPAPGQSLEEFLHLGVTPFIDSFTLVEARLDGKPLAARRVTTPLFSFTGATNLKAIDPCITGSPQLAVSDGYFVFIEPPAHLRPSLGPAAVGVTSLHIAGLGPRVATASWLPAVGVRTHAVVCNARAMLCFGTVGLGMRVSNQLRTSASSPMPCM